MVSLVTVVHAGDRVGLNGFRIPVCIQVNEGSCLTLFHLLASHHSGGVFLCFLLISIPTRLGPISSAQAGFRKTGWSSSSSGEAKRGGLTLLRETEIWRRNARRKNGDRRAWLILSHQQHGAHVNWNHTQDAGGSMDPFSGRRRPNYSRSSAWISFGQLSPALCETSAHPPETASSTYSPAKRKRK